MQTANNYSVEIIRYKISEADYNNFENAYIAAGKHLKDSKYCLNYQVIKGNEEPDNYIVIIHWTSKEEHLNGFRKSEEFKPFFELVKPFYNNIQEMKHYDLTPNTWTREQGEYA
jgi:quinol monooxygenase YgiN